MIQLMGAEAPADLDAIERMRATMRASAGAALKPTVLSGWRKNAPLSSRCLETRS